MPYKLRKARNKDLYYVVDSTGDKYSKEPIPLARAKRQITALHINTGHGGSKELVPGSDMHSLHVQSQCPVCLDDKETVFNKVPSYTPPHSILHIGPCGHWTCKGCYDRLVTPKKCPLCRITGYGKPKRGGIFGLCRPTTTSVEIPTIQSGTTYVNNPAILRFPVAVDPFPPAIDIPGGPSRPYGPKRRPGPDKPAGPKPENVNKKINGNGKEMDDERYRMFVRSLSNIPPPPPLPGMSRLDMMRQAGRTEVPNPYLEARRLEELRVRQEQRDRENIERMARQEEERRRHIEDVERHNLQMDNARRARQQAEAAEEERMRQLARPSLLAAIKETSADTLASAAMAGISLGMGKKGSGISRSIRYDETGNKIYDYFNTEGEQIASYSFPTQEETGLSEEDYKKAVNEELRKKTTELWHKDNESRPSRTNLKRKRGKDLNIKFNPEIARVVGIVPRAEDLSYPSYPPKSLADIIEDNHTEMLEAQDLESRGQPPAISRLQRIGRGYGGMFNPLNVKSSEDQAKAVITRILSSANAALAKSALKPEGQKSMASVMNEAARELAMAGNLGAVNYLNALRGPYEESPFYNSEDSSARNKIASEMGLMKGEGKLKFAKKYLKGQGLPHSRKECEKLCSVMDAEGVVFE
jgi:hypothetical protein